MTQDPMPPDRRDCRSVLFVCMGNICRSPVGEAVCRALARHQGLLDRLRIDSAGTIGYHAGAPADPRMRRHAQARGYQLEGRARRVTPDDLTAFDLIVAMDRENLRDLEQLAGGSHASLRLLGSFLDSCDETSAPDVPDPYYGGQEGFREVLDMIETAVPAILATLFPAPPDDR